MKALLFLVLLASLTACDRVKDVAKTTVRKTGEVVGTSATVLADGVATGAGRAAMHAELSAGLRERGLQLGQLTTGEAPAPDAGNAAPAPKRLTLYIVFNQAFADTVMVKLFNSEKQEYGRRRLYLAGRRDEARPVDVDFDPRTGFELGTRVVVE